MSDTTVLIRFLGEDDVTPVAAAVTNSVEGLGSATKTASSGFGALQSIATGAFQAIGGAAVNLAGAAFSKMTDFISGSIAEASEFQSIFAQTEAVVKSTGMAAGLTAQQMADMANAMSASSGNSIFADDAILGAQNVLATFTQIQGTNFGGATQAILDISQAMGTDLQSSALQVGKALNDPIAGISALSRVGVSFTDSQKAMIEAMVETGDVAGAQQIILAELNKEFGGSAAAAVDTYAGQQALLAAQFADIQQTLGEALLPVLVRFGSYASEVLVPIIGDLVTQFSNFITSVDWPGIISAIDELYLSSDAFITGIDWQGTLASIQAGFNTFLVAIAPITAAISNLYAVALPALTALYNAIVTQLASPQTQGYIQNIVTIFGLLGDILISVVAMAFNGMAVQVKGLTETFQYLWPYIQIVISGMMAIITPWQALIIGALTAISQLLKGDFAGAWSTIQAAVSVFVSTVQTAIGTFVTDVSAKIRGLVSSIVTEATAVGKSIADGIAKGISNGVAAITNAARGAAQSALNAAMALLGIASPSKVFANMVGKPISQGMAAGIMAGLPDVQNAMNATLGSGVNSAQATVQNYYQLSATYNTQQSESSIMADFNAMQVLAGGI
jgi:hypothetical protein